MSMSAEEATVDTTVVVVIVVAVVVLVLAVTGVLVGVLCCCSGGGEKEERSERRKNQRRTNRGGGSARQTNTNTLPSYSSSSQQKKQKQKEQKKQSKRRVPALPSSSSSDCDNGFCARATLATTPAPPAVAPPLVPVAAAPQIEAAAVAPQIEAAAVAPQIQAVAGAPQIEAAAAASQMEAAHDDEKPRNKEMVDVCGVTADAKAVAIYSTDAVGSALSRRSTVTDLVESKSSSASSVSVSPLVNPNFVPAVFAATYDHVLSVRQTTAQTTSTTTTLPGTSPGVPAPSRVVMDAGGSLDVIRFCEGGRDTSSAVKTTIALDPLVSSFLPSLVSVASNTNTKGHNQAFVATTDGANTAVVLFKEAENVGSYEQMSVSLAVQGMIQDMRVSPDGASLVIVTDARLPDANVYLYDIYPDPLPMLVAAISTQSAMYDSGSPPTTNDLTAVSAAFTPDNVDILIALTNGTGKDRILRISNTDASFQGLAFSSIPTTGVPRQVAVKIIASGVNYVVGRRGTDLLDIGNWLNFSDKTESFALNGNASGTVDIQNAPVVGANDSFVVIFNDGQNALVVNNAAVPALNTTVMFLTPVTRISFLRDGQKCYFGTNSSTAPTIYEQSMSQPVTAPQPVAITEPKTWYLTAASSADASGSFSDED